MTDLKVAGITSDMRHDPAIEQRRQPFACTAIAKLSEHESHVLVLPRDAPARAQRAIERLVYEPRDLGFVGHLDREPDPVEA